MGIYKYINIYVGLKLHNSFSGNICLECPVLCLCSAASYTYIPLLVCWAFVSMFDLTVYLATGIMVCDFEKPCNP
jgi:hypothetical protein